MVATASTQRFFHKPDADDWHAYRDDGTIALCGEAQLTYNIDQISDALPAGATLHPACQAALDGKTVEPTVISTPKAAPKSKGKSKAKS